MPEWRSYRDARHSLFIRFPADWQMTQVEGRSIKFQKGETPLPSGIADVDIFGQLSPLQGEFPADYLKNHVYPAHEGEAITRGIRYEDRQEFPVNGLHAVRARFYSSGPVPNWGIEYAIRKNDLVFDIYISQPRPEIEADFEAMIKTLHW